MAIDTAYKRNTAMLEGMILPDGSISTTDRASLLGQFFEIASIGDFAELFSFMARITRSFYKEARISRGETVFGRITRNKSITMER